MESDLASHMLYNILRQVPYYNRKQTAQSLYEAFPNGRGAKSATKMIIDEYNAYDDNYQHTQVAINAAANYWHDSCVLKNTTPLDCLTTSTSYVESESDDSDIPFELSDDSSSTHYEEDDEQDKKETYNTWDLKLDINMIDLPHIWEAKRLFPMHTLPGWFSRYRRGYVGPYSLTIEHKIATDIEIWSVELIIKQLNTNILPDLIDFEVLLKVSSYENNTWTEFILEGDRKFTFTYSTTTSSIQWSDTTSESLQLPPPDSELVRTSETPTNVVFNYYTDDSWIKYCDPPMCKHDQYVVAFHKRDIEQFLLLN